MIKLLRKFGSTFRFQKLHIIPSRLFPDKFFLPVVCVVYSILQLLLLLFSVLKNNFCVRLFNLGQVVILSRTEFIIPSLSFPISSIIAARDANNSFSFCKLFLITSSAVFFSQTTKHLRLLD